VDPVEALTRLGGIAGWREVRALTTRSEMRDAVDEGRVVRLPRHVVALPGATQARVCAAAAGGVISHLSAAQHWGWKVQWAPRLPEITVPRGRRLERTRSPLTTTEVRVHWGDLGPADLADGVTAPVRTVIDCARTLDFGAALSVADSALRSGLVNSAELLRAAVASPRTGRARALRVAQQATALAANPFESALRAIALDVPGLDVRPQVWVAGVGRADLVDERLGIVVEADSWEFHGNPEAFRVDVRRYAAFARRGRVVVRFDWDLVMGRPREVHATLVDVVRVREQQLFTNHCSSCPRLPA
jgi:very-short-patch-repair endonuclease